jgi:hypothetical protein
MTQPLPKKLTTERRRKRMAAKCRIRGCCNYNSLNVVVTTGHRYYENWQLQIVDQLIFEKKTEQILDRNINNFISGSYRENCFNFRRGKYHGTHVTN